MGGTSYMTRFRNTWAEINLDAIAHNVKQFKSLLPAERKVMGVVKADGYGHGSVEVAKTALSNGIDYLMVAYLEEAMVLRENGIEAPILVIGRTAPEYAAVAANNNITLAVFQAAWIEEVLNRGLEKPLQIHLEFETGFNRTGIPTEDELVDIVDKVKNSSGKIVITGVYTHFATADEIDSVHFRNQKQRYENMLEKLTNIYDKPLITHIGNSAAGIQYPERMLQYTRLGISLYGLYPSPDIKKLENIQLKQAFSLYSELIAVKRIKAGEYVGYGVTYQAEKDEWLGTVPIGYADGWSRTFQGFHVLVNGTKQQIVGRVCMDMLMIRLDDEYKVGQRVTLIGKDQHAEIDMDEVADYIHTINYEIPCMITGRVPREYVRNG